MIKRVCTLFAVACMSALLCVAPAAGQTVEEGVPGKRVFRDAPPALAPAFPEECDPFSVPDEFGEGCREGTGNDGASTLGGGGVQGAAFSGTAPVSPESVFRTPPRLECPAAVFVEEAETALIDCRASDEAGEEHLDYYWEPLGGTPQSYLDAPLLRGERTPTPLLAAPSSPPYETMESFLSEEATLRYRYRLTATSRVTGLSSRAEVEAYVLLRSPGVYCPSDVEVEEGVAVALSCEGADPLSFRMDYEAESSALWEWEGLWGSSVAPLMAADTPSPLFTAPSGSAGETYHYVASMTTSSSGVPRTARRRVSVRVVEGEETASLSASGSAPTITCKDVVVYATAPHVDLRCSATDAPADATYKWTTHDSAQSGILLLQADPLRPRIKISDYYNHQSKIPNEGINYKFKVSMKSSGAEVASETVTVKIVHPDLMTCAQTEFTAYVGDPNIRFDCRANENKKGVWAWDVGPLSVRQYRNYWRAKRRLQQLSVGGEPHVSFLVPKSLPDGLTVEYFEYEVCFSQEFTDPDIGKYVITESEYITVEVRLAITVTCADPPSPVYEGAPDIQLRCTASGVPGNNPAYSYAWTERGSTKNTDLLSPADISSPTFMTPDNVDQNETYEYKLTVSATNIKKGEANVTVKVLDKPAIAVTCADPPDPVYEDDADFALSCEASDAPGDNPAYSYAWTERGSTKNTDLLSAADISSPTFMTPDNVDQDETYEYKLTVEAQNAEKGTADVTVTVKNKGQIAVTCSDPAPVYEGSPDVPLSCEASGAPEGSAYSYAWAAMEGAPVDLLSATDISSPTFATPDSVDKKETYEYALTVAAEGAWSGTGKITVTVKNKGQIAVTCSDPDPVYEGSPDVPLSCEASDAPEGSAYLYAWAAMEGAPVDLLSATDALSPTFAVPDNVEKDETYAYKLTVTAENAESGEADVTVTVLDRPASTVSSSPPPTSPSSPTPPPVALSVACEDPDPVYEGSADVALSCEASGAPDGSAYEYAWASRGAAANTDLLSATDMASPTFMTPDEVDRTTRYEYRATVSAENAEDASADVTVTVLNKGALALACANPAPVYEGSPDVSLSCEASGAPDGSAYVWAWEARGAMADLSLLSARDVSSPTFMTPADVPRTTRYEYRVTTSAANAENASADVTVTVLNSGALALVCANPAPVYEGSPDVALSCEASGAPEGSAYAYAWEALGDTPADLLSAPDISSPTFATPDNVDRDETYAYRLTVTAANAEEGAADVTLTVLNKGALALTCPGNPYAVYEGSADMALECAATGAPDGSTYSYAWAPRGATTDADLLSATDIASPTFYVPDSVDRDETYEYRVTASAENAEAATADVTVTALDRPAPTVPSPPVSPPPAVALALTCANPAPVYEGSPDVALSCSASGAPEGSAYEYAWAPRGATADTDLLSATNVASPTFYVPDEVDRTTRYEYRATVTAENEEDAMADVTVTVLNKGALALTCPGNPYEVYEGEGDMALECAATGAPEGSTYSYAWEPRGATANTDLLSAPDVASPTFMTPDEVDRDETHEYRVTVTAQNAEAASADVTVTALDRPASPPASLFSADPSPLPIASGVSALRFGAQSAGGSVSLDPLTGYASPGVSGPRHAGRMTLAPEADLAFDENEEIALSVELVSPVLLRRASGASPSSSEPLELVPRWSMAASCDAPVSEAIRGLRVQAALSASDCLLLLFGGDVDLTDAAPGAYSGTIDIVLRAGAAEEARPVEVHVEVVPAQRAIAIGPGGVRFEERGDVPSVLAEEQRLVVYPEAAFMTREAPSGAFELTNPSLVSLEVTAAARFGYAEATEDGRERLVEDKAASPLGDLSEVVNIYPSALTLTPGERRVVRYGIDEEVLASMGERGYAAFFEVVSQPRRPGRLDRLPEDLPQEALQGGTARATLRMPGVYVPGGTAPRLSATLLSVSEGASPSATFLLETDGVPFFGEVSARDAEGRELGRSEALVYARSRVRIALERLPEGEGAFLRFAPRGGGALPAPAPVPWSAPRRSPRDIGAAEDNGRPTPNAALAGRP